MAEQYRVDLSEIEGTIAKLNRVIKDMTTSKSSCMGQTYLPQGALGTGFGEAEALYSAHEQMKERLYEIVQHLEDVLDDFGQKTKRTHDAFADAEAQNYAAFNGK
ncbi:WXG100 family type VII secretion target [Streptomyces sp. NPDC051243]|uniref:WXG100 family type VII secretion target n=1 Tax=Streptomyces sp. NPDC051243 TaxID=3365646 RepID=UPI0037AA2AF7